MQKSNRFAIIGFNKNAPTETFIRQHVEQLAGGKWYLYGAKGYYYFQDKSLTLNVSVWSKAYFKIFGKPEQLGYYGLSCFLKKNKITGILAEYGMVGVDLMEVCKKLTIPLFVHFHGYDASKYTILDFYKDKYKELFLVAHSIFVVSKKMHKDLLDMGCGPKKLNYNPCGPHPYFFSIKANRAAPYFISIGRFVEKKAPHLLILSFDKVVKQIPNARLIMIGDGYLFGACQWLVKSLKLEYYVQFTGALAHEEIRVKFQESFCLVQHSVTATDGDSEGTPVAILEAGAASLPVIATRHAGIPDVVIDGETGFLIEEGDVEAMAHAMITLYEDRVLCTKMGIAARAHIQANFSMEKHIGRIKEIMERTFPEEMT